MAHAAPFAMLRVARPSGSAQAHFELGSLVLSGPRVHHRPRALGLGAVSFAIHVAVVSAVVVLPLVVGQDFLPAPSEAVRAFFVPPPDVALPAPPPPPPPAGARALKPAPAVPSPAQDAKFVAPIEVPESVKPEASSMDFGVEGGVPGGVEGGVPGGVVGGVVGGLPTAPPPAAAAPVRVGGLIRVPKLQNRVDPIYPELARAARTSAVLILEATVGEDGRVRDVKVLRGQPLFDQAAVDAVRQWRYQPLLLNGVPVPFIASVTIQFRLVVGEP